LSYINIFAVPKSIEILLFTLNIFTKSNTSVMKDQTSMFEMFEEDDDYDEEDEEEFDMMEKSYVNLTDGKVAGKKIPGIEIKSVWEHDGVKDTMFYEKQLFLKYEDWKKFDEKNIFENLNTIKELEEFKKKLTTIKKDYNIFYKIRS